MTAATEDKQTRATGIPDLQAYFKRIRFEGEATPTLETLKTLHLLHPGHVPFENLNPLLGIPVKLDTPSLFRKIVQEKRGGYCFEQNLLFKAILESIGYNVRGLAARVLWNQPADAVTPRGHMLLLVEIDSSSYIADVGFGGQTLTAPLLLKAGLEQSTPHETFRFVAVDTDYRMETCIRGEWRTLYRFGMEQQHLVDYEVSSWYLSNHPASHFVTGLIAARTTPEARYALRNNELAVHFSNGTTEKQVISKAESLEQVLVETFGIGLPEPVKLRKALARITGTGEEG